MGAHTYILTIAGHDPSGGAGLTSDIKTFQVHGLYGLSVCTAITIQNDTHFKKCIWVKKKLILSQVQTLFNRFKIEVVKIGIIKNWKTLLVVLDALHNLNPDVKVILDPIIKATAGFNFHFNERQDVLDEIWEKCYLITPNYDEIQLLYPEKNIKDTIAHIASKTHVYLKGGHRIDKKGIDELYHSGNGMVNLLPNVKTVFQKHGSGCVLSSALASNICLNMPLNKAAIASKKYIEMFLNSNQSLLGTHN